MTQHKRNITGILNSAKEKRINAVNRVTKLLDDLAAQNRPVSFSYIAKAAGVSKAWIYRQEDIRRRIEELRLKTQTDQTKDPQPFTTAKSTVDSLKERIQKLEVENTALRKQLEVIYGRLHIEDKL